MQSLRRTLSVRFSFTMFVALFVIALWAFLGAQRILRRELDRGLAAVAHLESAVLVAGYELPAQPVHGGASPFAEEVNRYVVVRDHRGRAIGGNMAVAHDLPFDSAALAQAVRHEQAWSTQAWREERYRSVYLNVSHDLPGDTRVIQVAAALTPMESAARQVFLLMLGTVALGTVAASLGAGWLSRSTTAPVSEITAQAEAIAPGTVGQRITAHAQVEEFNRLVAVLNGMLERLDRGLLAQRRIIADVGHDLRTPLTALQGEVEVTLRNPRSPEQYQRVLRSVLEETNHLATISEALLLLARIEAGELAPRRVATDVGALAERAVHRLRQRVTDHPATLTPSPAADLGTADIDPAMVGLVLDHLLDNAVRHTPAGTPVRVDLGAGNGTLEFTVADEGPGVPPELLDHMFERFYRGDTARGRGGAGLGLTVAAAIVQAHGGSMSAAQAVPTGLRVTVRLPRHAPAVPGH
jgi:two-component system OmpR family sensor kinase